MLNTGREYAKAGIIIDEVTMEKLVIVTGGKGGWSGGSLDTTELLMDNQWTAGNSCSKEMLDFVDRFLKMTINNSFCLLI